MKMYQCPSCGRKYTATYCDSCGKTIPAKYAVFGSDSDGSSAGEFSGTDATNELLEKIQKAEERNNFLLAKIEKHTKLVAIFLIVYAVLAVISAIWFVGSVVPYL